MVFQQFCDKIQSNMHQIFTQMYLTVSIGPSHMESPTRFSQVSTPESSTNGVSPYFTKEAIPSVASPFFLCKNSWSPVQKIHKISVGPKSLLPPYFSVSDRISFLDISLFKQRFPFCLIFPHTGTLLNVHAVSIDPDVLP